MEVKLEQAVIQDFQSDTLLVNCYEGSSRLSDASEAVDRALGGALSELIDSGDLTGKPGEIVVVYPRRAIYAQRVIVVGLGKFDELDLEKVRKAAAAGIVRARDAGAKHVATVIHGLDSSRLNATDVAQATVEGSLLALYRYRAAKRSDQNPKEIELLSLVVPDGELKTQAQQGLQNAVALASGVYLARELVNLPPNLATPTRLAEEAQQIADRYNMQITIGDRDWAAQQGMGAFLAVAKGAGEPPKFIILEHNPQSKAENTIVLVGKGITFDTGGISIKPSEKMGEMKSDMGGAAAVLGAMKVVGELNPPVRVIGIAPCTENMPDANAYRPADVLTASNGKTIEIVTTDAEGRLILADALVYASRYKPQAVIDLATLTGACVIALGEGIAAGLFTNDDRIQKVLVESGTKTNERVWPMPLWDDYKQAIKSEVADMKNSGGRAGGVGSSAIFLKEFTDYPWAHLDIAPMALSLKDSSYIPAGGTGFGVRLLIEFIDQWSRLTRD